MDRRIEMILVHFHNLPTTPRVVFIPILPNISVEKGIEPLGINLDRWNLNWSVQIGFSKLRSMIRSMIRSTGQFQWLINASVDDSVDRKISVDDSVDASVDRTIPVAK